ncbi:MAG: hypothetical protein IK123_10700, partial [Lachnospiraceae bacterium]|nr:hypothetical protein [Lachnospiraceae bacterium]
MIYFISFCLALLLLLMIVSFGRNVDNNIVFLIIAVTIGNGGYYALALSSNIEEAILATKITYVMGSVAPMLMFLIICNICRVSIKRWLHLIMVGIQIIIYLSVCTIGSSRIFYKTVQFHLGTTGAYISKQYGPMHMVYLLSLLLYTFAGLAV